MMTSCGRARADSRAKPWLGHCVRKTRPGIPSVLFRRADCLDARRTRAPDAVFSASAERIARFLFARSGYDPVLRRAGRGAHRAVLGRLGREECGEAEGGEEFWLAERSYR